MFTLRRLRLVHSTALRRANATLDSISASSDIPAPIPTHVKPKAASKSNVASPVTLVTPEESGEATTQGRRRRKRPIPPQRPSISVENPRKWNPPIAEGVIPAYDMALKVIRKDHMALTEEARNVSKKIEELEKKVVELGGWGSETAKEVEAEMEQRREKLYVLEVQSQINLPEVRWRVANAMADMKKPVHRHLVQQKWQKDGDLDLLMERLHQMNVIPDVLPDLRPSIDVHVAAHTTRRELTVTKKRHTTVEPGAFLLPEQTVEPPNLYANVFHTDTRLYTMLLVDPDVPDEENQSFTTFLHWLKPNVPLTATHQARIAELNNHTPYIPPHPQNGTPYHRYVLLLLPQPPLDGPTYTRNAEARAQPGIPTSAHLDIPPVDDAGRRNFNVRAFVQHWGLDKVQGGGAHMWREIWDEKVSGIYESVLKVPEPRFGRPPKADPYAEYKERKRYV